MEAIRTQTDPFIQPAYRAPLLPQVGSSSYEQLKLRPGSVSINHQSTLSRDTHTYSNAFMNSHLPAPPLQQSFQSSPNHGTKRSAPDPDDDLERSSHIASHFKKLRLNNNRLQHLHNSNPEPDFGVENGNVEPTPAVAFHSTHESRDHPPRPSHSKEHTPTFPSNDFMTVDDTPDRVYIPDLDSEIASIEAAERSSAQLFLPDFDKQIGAIPDHVLRSEPGTGRGGAQNFDGRAESSNSRALVLYKDPTSITVPEEEDAVRKAVLEARRSIREKMRREQQRERETSSINVAMNGGIGRAPTFPPDLLDRSNSRVQKQSNMMEDNAGNARDEDAMDIE